MWSSDVEIADGPLLKQARSWPWAMGLAASMVLLRLIAVLGIHLYRYFDSAEYDILDFSGRSRRPWATPLFYRLLPEDPRAIIVAQALLGAVAWTVLALAVAAWFRNGTIRLVVAVTLSALGLTTAVTNWDTTKLSESMALSLTVLLVAAWTNLVRRPVLANGVLVLAVALPWLFVRQSLMPTAWMLVVLTAVALAWQWRNNGRHTEAWRTLAMVLVGLVAFSSLATVSYGRNNEILHHNLTVIVMNRIAPDAERLGWFLDEGMPLPASGGRSFEDFDQDPVFQRWIDDEGSSTYARFLISHPWYTVTEPLDDFGYARPSYQDEEQPQVTMLAPGEGYGSARTVLPEPVEQLLFGAGEPGTVIAALVVVAVWSLARGRWIDKRWIVPVALAALSIAGLYAAWHGATPELSRLGMVSAIGLRIALIIQLGLLAESELDRR